MKPTCFTVQSEQSVPLASYKTDILFRLNSRLAIALLHMYAYVIINILMKFGHELCCVIVFFWETVRSWYDWDIPKQRWHLASEVPQIDISFLLKVEVELIVELCGFDKFCVLILLCAVCVMPECSEFWHHGVLCVGILAKRAPQGFSCWTAVNSGGGFGGVGPDAENHGELQQCLLGSSHPVEQRRLSWQKQPVSMW